jgi:hypothetical protein
VDDLFGAEALLAGDDEPPRPRGQSVQAPQRERVPAARPSQPESRGRRAPLPVAASVAALWAAVLGFAPVLVLTGAGAIGTGASVAGVFRVATSAWLLGHGVPVSVGSDRITLVPLAITAWVGWRLVRAGVHASRAAGANRADTAWPAVRAGLAVAVVYALIGAVVAIPMRSAVSPLRTLLCFGVVAGATAVGGGLGHGRLRRRLLRRVPGLLTQAVRAGLAAAAFLLAAGAAAGGLALALSGREATQMLHAYAAGVSGQIGITSLCLVYLPDLAVWSTAYLIGPGFAVGTGTVVSPGDVLVGPLPALPVFAALPTRPLTGVGPTLLGVPFIAGIAAGLLLGRRPSEARASMQDAGWGRLLGAAVLAGPVAGVLVAVAMRAAHGGLGSGRLADLGPNGAGTALLAAAVIAVGTVGGAVARRSLTRG